MSVKYFSSTDAGAKILSNSEAKIHGASGDLVKLLNATLILGTGVTSTGAGPTLANQTAAWQQMGAGAAFFVANNAVTDIAYLGGAQKFGQVILKFATAGVGGSVTFKYWNGSAWTAFSPTDGTSGLTQDGTISWNADSLTGWATVAQSDGSVSQTHYWIQIVWATAYSTNPVVKLASIYGWGSPFQGTNGASYRSQLVSGVQPYLTVNDNSPNGTSLGKEAWAYAAESLTQYNTDQQNDGSNGVTKPVPTLAQGAGGNTGHVVVRKSAANDTTTGRVWHVLMDEKTFYVFIISGDATANHIAFGFGEFFSLIAGDAYRWFISGRLTENSATITGANGLNPLCHRMLSGGGTTNACTYVARAYTGVGGSLLVSLGGSVPNFISATNSSQQGHGVLTSFNPEDAGVFVFPVFVVETTTLGIRGRMRGLWDWPHTAAGMNDQDAFAGNGALVSRTFVEFKITAFVDTSTNADNTGGIVGETSNTWETN